MKPLTVAQAASFAGGRVVGDETVCITGISTDSRSIPEGALFLALCGERFDGHKFIGKAIENGAAAVVSSEEIDVPVPVIRVEDTGRALLALAGGYRSLFHMPVVGITGSVGKTTTKEMTASVLREKYRTMYTQGNLNNEIGMPLTVFRMEDETEAAVLEMGMSDFQEISRMTAQAKPDIAVITNIGVSHIEFLGSREGICKAKLEILEGLRPGGTAILCGDEPLLWEKRESLGVKTIYFGIENPACEVRAENIMLSDDCVQFTAKVFDRTFAAEIHTAGRHNVYNALAAAAVGAVLGLQDEEIAAGLAAFTDLHQSVYRKDGFMVIDACYNASPDSVEASLDVLHELDVNGKRFAVLGGMRELGGYQDEGHRRCGRRAAVCADFLYALGDGAEQYREGAREAGMPDDAIRLFSTHEEMAQALREAAKPGDALLFKGSRYWAMEKVLDGFLAEDNRER
ncbi:MAG: UDP-N-acetylmuramoyl-tripeptide--D-alanyl-D-alanine ligase [Eubacteriales bacterium]|nr:UDP-N-acetylmuramoyl-tripeptide--D-alanyl-D-alanine ligase [Eubacteriales bacterium]